MIRKILLLFCLPFCLCTGQNLIRNGDFTEAGTEGRIPHWTIWFDKPGPDSSVSLDTTNSRTGGVSLAIMHREEKLYTRIEQLHIPCKPHTSYVARFYVKGQNLRTSCKGGVRMFIGPHGDILRPICQFGPGLEHFKREVPNPWTFDWTLYESPVFGSGDSSELGVTLFLRFASGTVWFDNVELYEYSPDLSRNMEVERTRKLIGKDIGQVEKLAPELAPELADLRRETENFFPAERDPRKGMPFHAPQEKLGQLFSRELRKRFPGRDMIVSLASDPLAPQSAYFIPEKDSLPSGLLLCGLHGETESFAVNLTNCTEQPQTVRFSIPDDLEMVPRLAVHVETDRCTEQDDALPRLRAAEDGLFSVSVPSGMTRQIYFTVPLQRTTDSMLTFGSEILRIELRPKKEGLPPELPFTLFSYEHPSFGLYRQPELTRKMFTAMHQNAIMPYQFESPLPVFDGKGEIHPEQMNWEKLDLMRYMKPLPQKLVLHLPVNDEPHITPCLGTDGGKPIPVYSAEWERRIILWLRALLPGLRQRGIGYDRLLIQLKDEPGEKDMPYMEKLAAVVRKADPNLRIYSNFNHSIPSDKIASLAQFVDVLAPEILEMTPETMEILKSSGREIWCYHVQTRTVPGSRIRDLFRFLNMENVRGYSFWCFKDHRSSWEMGQGYSVVYDGDPDEWITSKRSEGIRLGVEDFTLLERFKVKNPDDYVKIGKAVETMSRDEFRSLILRKME